jgi:hypothetical protein
VLWVVRDSDRCSQGESVAGVRDASTDPFGDRGRGGGVDGGEEHDELFTAIAGDEVVAA